MLPILLKDKNQTWRWISNPNGNRISHGMASKALSAVPNLTTIFSLSFAVRAQGCQDASFCSNILHIGHNTLYVTYMTATRQAVWIRCGPGAHISLEHAPPQECVASVILHLRKEHWLQEESSRISPLRTLCYCITTAIIKPARNPPPKTMAWRKMTSGWQDMGTELQAAGAGREIQRCELPKRQTHHHIQWRDRLEESEGRGKVKAGAVTSYHSDQTSSGEQPNSFQKL